MNYLDIIRKAKEMRERRSANLKVWASFLSVIALFLAFIYFNAGGNGIHPIGSNAVYLAGEACTINFELDRNIQDMEQEFQECVRIHRVYAEK